MNSTRRANIYVFGYLSLLSILMLGQALSMEGLPDSIEFTSNQILMMKVGQIVSVLILFILPAIIYAVFFNTEKLKVLNIHRLGNYKYMALSILCFLSALPMINYMGEWNMKLHLPAFLSDVEQVLRTAEENVEKLMYVFLDMKTPGDLVFNLFMIAFMAALSEELFFRGVLQKHLIKITQKTHLSIWITAILFSALHGQFFGFFPRMILGAILGYFYVFSGSLWVPILGHFINNGAQVLMIYYYLQTHSMEEIKALNMGTESISLVLVSLISTVLLIFMGYHTYKRDPLIR